HGAPARYAPLRNWPVTRLIAETRPIQPLPPGVRGGLTPPEPERPACPLGSRPPARPPWRLPGHPHTDRNRGPLTLLVGPGVHIPATALPVAVPLRPPNDLPI